MARKPTTQVTYEGKTQFLAAWAREYQIPVSVLRERLTDGWSIEAALTRPLPERRAFLVEHDGRNQSVAEWSKETGIPKQTISARLRWNWPVRDALTKPVRLLSERGGGTRREGRKQIPPTKRQGFRPKPKDGRCECCSEIFLGAGTKGLQGDHDRETEAFRGWLCFHCNTGIGKLGDNAGGLRRALDYLEHGF